MGNTTSIEWAANADGTPGATWNPIRARDTVTGLTGTFCVHASPGCRNCYAETMQGRKLPGNGIGLAYTAPNLKRVEHYLDEKMLAAPLKRRKPTTYFLSSMTDVFGEWVPDAMLDRLFAVMALSPRHTFIVVTKRAVRMRSYMGAPSRPIAAQLAAFPFHADRFRAGESVFGSIRYESDTWFLPWPLPNVWLVVSVEDQGNAVRILDLAKTPAAVRGVSYEPALGALDLERVHGFTDGEHHALDALRGNCSTRARIGLSDEWFHEVGALPALDWVICGGESGRNARPMHPDWARSLRDQCAAAGVPFFFKQWGEHAVIYDRDVEDPDWRRCDVVHREHPRGQWLNLLGGQGFHGERVVYAHKVGKARAGRLLDGQEHNARPPIGGH